MAGEETTHEVKSRQSSLKRAIERSCSLISLSHSVKVFALKWQLIRNKLEELNSGLVSIEDAGSGRNPAVSGLVRALMVALGESGDLAKRCVDLSYSGKLLMQSDLDIILAKFDRFVKNLAEIYSTGILTPANAIVVSRPGLGACKEDMRFYVRDLLTRMKIGDTMMKKQALVSLHEVMNEDDRYVRIVVEVGGIVNVLVGFLDFSEVAEIQEEAVKAVLVIARFDWCKGVLVGAGIIWPLIRVLECGSEKGKEGSARCLMKLTENADNAWSVSAHGGVTALLKVCANGNSKAELICLACGVLRNLVQVEEIKRFMVEEGAVSTFIKLSQSKVDNVRNSSIEFLQSIASEDDSIRQMVIREGGIRALVRILDPTLLISSKTRELSLQAIEKLCFSLPNCIDMLVSYGFIELLLNFLRKGEVSVQELALKVAAKLCATSEEAKRALGDAGFLPEFVRFLDAKSFEVREMAAEALSAMVLVPKNRKRFVQEDHNIGLLIRLLEPEEVNSSYKKFLLSTLMAITGCHRGRKKIVNSGHLKTLEKLAEAEVSDAKRLVRKLSTNRFRSMLSGIWHP
ncbi:uncharacterized protein LOC115739770 [Rhodamnia argentea]|uniref:Uncharacterized protein LOC115739770 n=1 Tax=Rhodamnia argentea TaxID=178133 RepID=A0A8B8P259_9MYRT|nr:uncharacterized protein LOC115739770 [Rhodamnia argentea]